jgi:DNA invertase Pin-like site-specific DNA recombinase
VPVAELVDVPLWGGHLVGYARVSTLDQDPALQLDALERAGCGRVFVEKASGARQDRPQLAAALDYARAGDVLVVWRLDRLGRSLRHLLELVDELGRRQVGLRSLTEQIDTTSAGGRLVFQVFAALGEFERELTRERTMAGLAAARARGRKGGRKPVVTPAKLTAARALLDGGTAPTAAAAAVGVSRSSLYRALSAVAAPGSA